MLFCKYKDNSMKKTGLYSLHILLFCLFLSSCAIPSQKLVDTNRKKNIEYNAILTDPVVKQDFRNLKSIAVNAPIYNKANNPSFDEVTLTKLNEASAILIDRLKNHYHLNENKYKLHTYIGRNKLDSCYQYYNSYEINSIGKSCGDFSADFGSCKLCNDYVKTVKSRSMKVIHSRWWNNTETTALIDTFKLRNGDFVYLGLELSPND